MGEKYYYMGKDIEELTKEELIEALICMDDLLKQERELHSASLEMLVNTARRASGE